MSPIHLDPGPSTLLGQPFPLVVSYIYPQRGKGEMSLVLSFLSFLACPHFSPLALGIIVPDHSMNAYASYHLLTPQRKERTLW